MENTKYTTKEELFAQLGLSKSTFYRKLIALGLRPKRGLLSPAEQASLREALGMSAQPPQESGTK